MNWLQSVRHARTFGHWPAWVRFDAFHVCERCLRPPNRPRRVVPVLTLRPRPW